MLIEAPKKDGAVSNHKTSGTQHAIQPSHKRTEDEMVEFSNVLIERPAKMRRTNPPCRTERVAPAQKTTNNYTTPNPVGKDLGKHEVIRPSSYLGASTQKAFRAGPAKGTPDVEQPGSWRVETADNIVVRHHVPIPVCEPTVPISVTTMTTTDKLAPPRSTKPTDMTTGPMQQPGVTVKPANLSRSADDRNPSDPPQSIDTSKPASVSSATGITKPKSGIELLKPPKPTSLSRPVDTDTKKPLSRAPKVWKPTNASNDKLSQATAKLPGNIRFVKPTKPVGQPKLRETWRPMNTPSGLEAAYQAKERKQAERPKLTGQRRIIKASTTINVRKPKHSATSVPSISLQTLSTAVPGPRQSAVEEPQKATTSTASKESERFKIPESAHTLLENQLSGWINVIASDDAIASFVPHRFRVSSVQPEREQDVEDTAAVLSTSSTATQAKGEAGNTVGNLALGRGESYSLSANHSMDSRQTPARFVPNSLNARTPVRGLSSASKDDDSDVLVQTRNEDVFRPAVNSQAVSPSLDPSATKTPAPSGNSSSEVARSLPTSTILGRDIVGTLERQVIQRPAANEMSSLLSSLDSPSQMYAYDSSPSMSATPPLSPNSASVSSSPMSTFEYDIGVSSNLCTPKLNPKLIDGQPQPDFGSVNQNRAMSCFRTKGLSVSKRRNDRFMAKFSDKSHKPSSEACLIPMGHGEIYLHVDPRLRRCHQKSDPWYTQKQKEIKARGGRKAWFGRCVQRTNWLQRQDQEKSGMDGEPMVEKETTAAEQREIEEEAAENPAVRQTPISAEQEEVLSSQDHLAREREDGARDERQQEEARVREQLKLRIIQEKQAANKAREVRHKIRDKVRIFQSRYENSFEKPIYLD